MARSSSSSHSQHQSTLWSSLEWSFPFTLVQLFYLEPWAKVSTEYLWWTGKWYAPLKQRSVVTKFLHQQTNDEKFKSLNIEVSKTDPLDVQHPRQKSNQFLHQWSSVANQNQKELTSCKPWQVKLPYMSWTSKVLLMPKYLTSLMWLKPALHEVGLEGQRFDAICKFCKWGLKQMTGDEVEESSASSAGDSTSTCTDTDEELGDTWCQLRIDRAWLWSCTFAVDSDSRCSLVHVVMCACLVEWSCLHDCMCQVSELWGDVQHHVHGGSQLSSRVRQ